MLKNSIKYVYNEKRKYRFQNKITHKDPLNLFSVAV